MEKEKKVFISYSRADKEEVFPFVSRIDKELRIECWVDKKGIESGSEFQHVIKNTIDDSEVVLFMVSVSSLLSEWTYKEIMYAKNKGKRIVPVLLTGQTIRGWFKAEFEKLDFIDISNSDQVEKLFDDLRNWIGKPKTQKWKCDDNNITVVFPDGEEISDKSMNQTLIECILKIGPKEIMNLHYRPNKDELIYEYDIPVLRLTEIIKGRSKYYVQKLQGKNITESLVKISDALDCGLTIYTPFAEKYEPDKDIVKDTYKNYFKNLSDEDLRNLYREAIELLDNESSTEDDYAKALEKVKIVACANKGCAWVQLGMMYERGRGTEENLLYAIQCYQKASELNEPYGDYNLAYYYLFGWEFDQDLDEAIRLFNKAYSNGVSDKDIANAYYNVARNLDDEEVIKEYCLKAQDLGHELAKDYFKSYEEREYGCHMQKVHFEIEWVTCQYDNLYVVGTLSSGYILANETIVIKHNNEEITTKALELYSNGEIVDSIMPGDEARIMLVGVQKKQIQPGDIVGLPVDSYLEV